MRRAVIALLCVWCVLGGVATAIALTGPSVWWNRTGTFDGIVGMPLRGAVETATIRSLLPPRSRGAERWAVLFPPGSDDQVLMYVQFQLAHLEYPRRVDVVAGTSVPESSHYDGVITAPGLILPLPWKVSGEHGGFTRHAIVGT